MSGRVQREGMSPGWRVPLDRAWQRACAAHQQQVHREHQQADRQQFQRELAQRLAQRAHLDIAVRVMTGSGRLQGVVVLIGMKTGVPEMQLAGDRMESAACFTVQVPVQAHDLCEQQCTDHQGQKQVSLGRAAVHGSKSIRAGKDSGGYELPTA